jgi:hypothetical protein
MREMSPCRAPSRSASSSWVRSTLLRFARQTRSPYFRVTPAAAAEEIQRRREEIGFSYFVVSADVADALAPGVAELAGREVLRVVRMPSGHGWVLGE